MNNPYQDELRRTISQNGPTGLPEKDMFGRPWPQSPAPAPAPTSHTMPIGGAPSVTPAKPMTFAGAAPKHAMEGFDFSREQNTGKSAKDAFAHLSNQAPPPPINDKAALAAWFSQHIRPGMDALGHNVSDVQGDKFRFKNWQGDYWVDYGRGAGADGGALAWQAEDANGPQVQGTYQPMGQRQGPVMPGQSDLMAQILDSLQDQQEPTPQELLQQQFGI